MSRLLAVLALLPLLVRGLAIQCALGAPRMNTRTASSAPVAHETHGEHAGDNACDDNEKRGCGVSHDSACTAMTSCAQALTTPRMSPLRHAPPPAAPFPTTHHALIEAPLALETPPPRA
jgi:hypothetical protein